MAVISIHGDYANDEDMAVSYGQASGAVPTGYRPLLSTLKYLRRNSSFGLKDIDQTETHWGGTHSCRYASNPPADWFERFQG